MKSLNVKKTTLATSISLLLSSAAIHSALAQEAEVQAAEDEVEVVLVKGIRGSLIRSMDLKRESSGVMDAISAEEMGKFPDTNLAESLQRITGVTVSRSNGEGSEITVRGFGPEFNLVTLNGRQMPSTGFSRSFKFENLSSEGVGALEVYKTARADIPTGGLGATVNIATNKPLNQPGERQSYMVKGMHDSSNQEGRTVTPEFAGLYSNTYLDDTLGFAVTFSRHRRDFQQQRADVGSWFSNVSLPTNLDPANATDNRLLGSDGNPLAQFKSYDEASGKYVEDTVASFFPRELSFGFADVERERINSQLTLQYAATDNLVATVDYTTTDTTTAVNEFGWGVWKPYGGGTILAYELDETGTARYVETIANDASITAFRSTNEVKSRSLGFNLGWQVSDSLDLTLDYHDSSSSTDDGADHGIGGSALAIVGSDLLSSKSYDFRSGEIPGFTVNYLNGTSEMAPGEISHNFDLISHAPGKSEIEQLQLSGKWLPEFDLPLTQVSFGVGRIEQKLGGSSSLGRIGVEGLVDYIPEIHPDSLFVRHDTSDLLDAFDGGGSDLSPNYYYTFDIEEILARDAAYFNTPISAYQGDPVTISEVTEEITSAYINSVWEFDIGEYPVQINAGVRYETTDVVSPSKSKIPLYVEWQSPGVMWTQFEGGEDALQEVLNTGSYDVVLPMFDFRIDITDDIVGRISWGETIARAGLGNLLGGTLYATSVGFDQRSGSRGNPNVKPYLSNNLDISLEYYYDDASYASIGLYKKDVEDWIVSTQTQLTFDGLHDIIGGARYNEAEAQLVADGIATPTRAEIYGQMLVNGHGDANGVIVPDPNTDPLITWTITSPENVDKRSVEGMELAWQHVFGESGFGTSINATFVEGDVEVDPYIYKGGQQAALAGLSDSLNWQGFYEKDGLSVKLTYAWRDKYFLGFGHTHGPADNPPKFFQEFGQWDVSVNYDIDDNLTVFFEGINLNNETEQGYGRFESQFMFARQYGTRYILGARYTLD
jgi:iron complex outermembrane receptor protein